MGVMKEIATRMATDPNLAGKDPGNRCRHPDRVETLAPAWRYAAGRQPHGRVWRL